MTAVEKLISVAVAEEGYCEKKTNANLDDKLANAGSGNYTKYARDLVKMIGTPYAQGVAWCDIFVDWCFIMAFGLELAKQMLNGWSAYTPTSADYYRKMKRWYTTPVLGDQVFFKNTNRINHTGIVVQVTSDSITTIEGNANNKVSRRTYLLKNPTIAGYGRPRYELVPEELAQVVTKLTAAIVNGVDISEALDPNKFDIAKYRSTFADLNTAFGDDWTKYYWHYVTVGKKEIAAGLRQEFMNNQNGSLRG